MRHALRGLLICAGLLLLWQGFRYFEYSDEKERMQRNIARITSGESDELVNPNARFLYLLLRDRACVQRVHRILFGKETEVCSVSDGRFRDLQSLPNLQSITLSDTIDTMNLMESFRGKKSLRSVTICRSFPSRGDEVTKELVECIADLPEVHTVEFFFSLPYDTDLEALEGKQSINRLVLGYWPDSGQVKVIPSNHLQVIKSLPNLHSVAVYNCRIENAALMAFQTIPHLQEIDLPLSVQQFEVLRGVIPGVVIHKN